LKTIAAEGEFGIPAQMAGMPAVSDRADLDQSHSRLYRPARARHAALAL